jgi:hypothetical protein
MPRVSAQGDGRMSEETAGLEERVRERAYFLWEREARRIGPFVHAIVLDSGRTSAAVREPGMPAPSRSIGVAPLEASAPHATSRTALRVR